MMVIRDLGVALMASGAEEEAHALFEKTGHEVGMEAIEAMDQ
jgi:hypothetical protein